MKSTQTFPPFFTFIGNDPDTLPPCHTQDLETQAIPPLPLLTDTTYRKNLRWSSNATLPSPWESSPFSPVYLQRIMNPNPPPHPHTTKLSSKIGKCRSKGEGGGRIPLTSHLKCRKGSGDRGGGPSAIKEKKKEYVKNPTISPSFIPAMIPAFYHRQ